MQRRAQFAESDDPRAIFYKALLNSDTYEAYLAALGGNVAVFPKTFGNGQVPVTAEAEYKYVRDRRHWISEFATAPQEIEYSEAEKERLTLRDLASRKAVIQALEECRQAGARCVPQKIWF